MTTVVSRETTTATTAATSDQHAHSLGPAAAKNQAQGQQPTAAAKQACIEGHLLAAEFAAAYQLIEVLGHGGFGVTYRALCNATGEAVAVKFIAKNKVAQWIQDPELGSVPLEVHIVKNMHEKHIIGYRDVFADDVFVYLVMELFGVAWSDLPTVSATQRTKSSCAPTSPAPPPPLAPLPSPDQLPAEAGGADSGLGASLSQQSVKSPPYEASAMQTWPPGSPGRAIAAAAASAVPPSTLMNVATRVPCLARRQSMDLFECLSLQTAFPEKLARRVFSQVVGAVTALLDQGILHRDIKDENVLCDSDYQVRLIDFGSAAVLPKDGSLFDTFAGTMEYCPPEILQGQKYRGPEQEVWSLGTLLYLMVFGEPPFSNPTAAVWGRLWLPPRSMRRRGCCQTVQLPPATFGYGCHITRLLSGMLAKDPRCRLTLEQVRTHPWMVAQ
ncbi:kinase-like domain-containing protein [Blastocladiella britannica]|nr:kinase-like domain-containing protein [Blastocladiella britannica]